MNYLEKKTVWIIELSGISTTISIMEIAQKELGLNA